jgi:hypothetical protein
LPSWATCGDKVGCETFRANEILADEIQTTRLRKRRLQKLCAHSKARAETQPRSKPWGRRFHICYARVMVTEWISRDVDNSKRISKRPHSPR